jgi:hypothetical protein
MKDAKRNATVFFIIFLPPTGVTPQTTPLLACDLTPNPDGGQAD